jgi:hypothetical protein
MAFFRDLTTLQRFSLALPTSNQKGQVRKAATGKGCIVKREAALATSIYPSENRDPGIIIRPSQEYLLGLQFPPHEQAIRSVLGCEE